MNLLSVSQRGHVICNERDHRCRATETRAIYKFVAYSQYIRIDCARPFRILKPCLEVSQLLRHKHAGPHWHTACSSYTRIHGGPCCSRIVPYNRIVPYSTHRSAQRVTMTPVIVAHIHMFSLTRSGCAICHTVYKLCKQFWAAI